MHHLFRKDYKIGNINTSTNLIEKLKFVQNWQRTLIFAGFFKKGTENERLIYRGTVNETQGDTDDDSEDDNDEYEDMKRTL